MRREHGRNARVADGASARTAVMRTQGSGSAAAPISALTIAVSTRRPPFPTLLPRRLSCPSEQLAGELRGARADQRAVRAIDGELRERPAARSRRRSPARYIVSASSTVAVRRRAVPVPAIHRRRRPLGRLVLVTRRARVRHAVPRRHLRHRRLERVIAPASDQPPVHVAHVAVDAAAALRLGRVMRVRASSTRRLKPCALLTSGRQPAPRRLHPPSGPLGSVALRAQLIALRAYGRRRASRSRTFSECVVLRRRACEWQLVHVASPFAKQPVTVSACGRLKRLGRPSGQNSPCGSFGRNRLADQERQRVVVVAVAGLEAEEDVVLVAVAVAAGVEDLPRRIARVMREDRAGARGSSMCGRPGPWHASQPIPISVHVVAYVFVAALKFWTMLVAWQFTQVTFQICRRSCDGSSGIGVISL